MEPIVLNAAPREGLGKEANRKLRASGGTPAVLYGFGLSESLPVTIEPKQLVKALENPKKANALMSVDLGSDAGAHTVLVREIQRHPVRREILHVDLVAPNPEKPVVSTIPVRFTGKSSGVSMGGRLRTPYRDVQVLSKPADIPVEVVVDITSMEIGDMVKASELALPENVSVVFDQDFVVVKVQKPRGGAAAAAANPAATDAATESEE